jgi:hypothetical protein
MTKKQRMADCARRERVASMEVDRRQEILNNYLTSRKVKRLEKALDVAENKLNAIIHEYNALIMEDYKPPKEPLSEPTRWVSVDGELRQGYKDDPKSW